MNYDVTNSHVYGIYNALSTINGYFGDSKETGANALIVSVLLIAYPVHTILLIMADVSGADASQGAAGPLNSHRIPAVTQRCPRHREKKGAFDVVAV